MNGREMEKRLQELIPGGAHTYSKGADQFPSNAPKVITHGKGVYIYDVDGKTYLDWCMGLYSVLFGHAYEPVVRRVREQLEKGTNFQRPAIEELELAEMLTDIIPCADMVKFAKNGSTVTTAAFKLARAYTGKEKIAICAEHPFFSYDDWFIGSTPCAEGITESEKRLSVKFKYNDLESVRKVFKEHRGNVAALILEPMKFEEPKDDFLHEVQALCKENGTVFILDEMITGFRFPLGGAQKYFDIEPDLTTFGKAVANGFSMAFLAGKREIMEMGGIEPGKKKVFLVSTTHGAETHSLVAAMATIEELRNKKVIDHLWNVGEQFLQKVPAIAQEIGLSDYVGITGHKYLPLMTFKDHSKEDSLGFKTLFMQELVKRGILFQGMFVSAYMHTQKDIDRTLDAIKESLQVYRKAIDAKTYRDLLEGDPIKPVFRRVN
ncbi:MAG: glutamate-1-semialdehyde 2,1-aminomutase [Gallionellales bacterium RIFCSPHIGHO2_02_FULL_57_16]|nr:MAG: glutamate-1-semialdehyde 2,1-aminomutase [Gallionellales bacterium RIFCSPHIGHO2_02_FULL_57_16]